MHNSDLLVPYLPAALQRIEMEPASFWAAWDALSIPMRNGSGKVLEAVALVAKLGRPEHVKLLAQKLPDGFVLFEMCQLPESCDDELAVLAEYFWSG